MEDTIFIYWLVDFFKMRSQKRLWRTMVRIPWIDASGVSSNADAPLSFGLQLAQPGKNTLRSSKVSHSGDFQNRAPNDSIV